MKKLLGIFFLLAFTSGVNAAFINNANNTITDDSTGLDWLALSVTTGQAYADAETLNVGWRYATNLEVEGMVAELFQSVIYNSNGYSDANLAIAMSFNDLFGLSRSDFASYGLYLDEEQLLRMAAAWGDASLPLNKGGGRIFGDEFDADYSSGIASGRAGFGVYLVRGGNTAVPEASSIYLLGFGVLGLLGVAKRKRLS